MFNVGSSLQMHFIYLQNEPSNEREKVAQNFFHTIFKVKLA